MAAPCDMMISYSNKTKMLVSNEVKTIKMREEGEQYTKKVISSGDNHDLQTLAIDTLDE